MLGNTTQYIYLCHRNFSWFTKPDQIEYADCNWKMQFKNSQSKNKKKQGKLWYLVSNLIPPNGRKTETNMLLIIFLN